VHDYFAILGIAPGAPASVIRSAHSRRRAAVHPDFRASGDRPVRPRRGAAFRAGRPADAAVNFIEMSALVDGMEAAFFHSRG
jgi:hypothetical protein